MRPGPVQRAATDLSFGIGIGICAAIISLGVSLLINPLFAPLVPFAMLFGLVALTQPVAAALMLVGLAYLDALGKMVFFFSPLSPFKLFTGIAVVALMLQVTRFRAGIQEVANTPAFRAYLAFMMAWVIAFLMAESMRQAFSWAIDIATVAIILPLTMFILQKEEHVRWGIWILGIASAISALILTADVILGTRLVSTSDAATTARTAEGFDRSSGGSNENPTTAATMMLTGTIIAMVHALESPVRRKLFTAMALVGLLGVLLSFARSSFLVAGIIMVLLAIRYRQHRLFPLMCILGLIGAAALLPFMPESFWDRILSILSVFGGGGDWTLGRRLSYNLIGLELLSRNPIFGVGPGNFFSNFTNAEFRFLPGRTLTGRQLHNMYLSVAVEYGIVGFACFMALILSGFGACRDTMRRAASAQTRATATALFYGMLAYFLVSVFVPNEYNKYTWLLPALATALWVSSGLHKSRKGHR